MLAYEDEAVYVGELGLLNECGSGVYWLEILYFRLGVCEGHGGLIVDEQHGRFAASPMGPTKRVSLGKGKRPVDS